MTVDTDRLLDTPQPLLHAAVQQALRQADMSSDPFLKNVDILLRSNNEVLNLPDRVCVLVRAV